MFCFVLYFLAWLSLGLQRSSHHKYNCQQPEQLKDFPMFQTVSYGGPQEPRVLGT